MFIESLNAFRLNASESHPHKIKSDNHHVNAHVYIYDFDPHRNEMNQTNGYF